MHNYFTHYKARQGAYLKNLARKWYDSLRRREALSSMARNINLLLSMLITWNNLKIIVKLKLRKI
jgi:hypothetical protein